MQYARRARVLALFGIMGLMIQLLSPASLSAATPGVDVAPAGQAAAAVTGSGNGQWTGTKIAPSSTTSQKAQSGAAAKHDGAATHAGTAPSVAAPNAAASNLQYYPLAQPFRLFDSRPGNPACSVGIGPDQGGFSYNNPVAGLTCNGISVPANAVAVTGNVTVVASYGSGPGFVTLYPNGTSLPTTSNANYVDGQTIPNAFTVALGTGGSFRDYVLTTVDVILDITGYYAPAGAGGLYFHRLASPIRYLDTRPGYSAYSTPGTPDVGGLTYSGTVAGISYGGVSIPANATAISGNATVVADQNAGPGFLTLFPTGGALPTVSNNNYTNGLVTPNAFFVGLGSGKLSTYNLTTINVIIDINGYFSTSVSDANGAGVLYNTLAYPIRMYDSRPGTAATACFGGTGAFPGGSNFIIRGGGTFNGVLFSCQGITIPTSAVAVTGNATVVADQNSGPGFVTLFPPGVSRPNASNLNYVDGQVVPNFFISGVGPVTASNSGNVYSNAFLSYALTTINEIFDLNGYFA